MTRRRKNILFLLITIISVVFLSYLLFLSGVTDKIQAGVIKSSVDDSNVGNYPVIDMVINSSGENYVNTDVTLIIKATSNYKINKIEYSFDLKKWKRVNKKFNSKNVTYKMTFTKTMNSYVYIRVVNDLGYKSYAYKTLVMIDKEKPKLALSYNDDGVVIKASDNNKISSVQYSYDCVNWDTKEVSKKSVVLNERLEKQTCVRVVDNAGNISSVRKVSK